MAKKSRDKKFGVLYDAKGKKLMIVKESNYDKIVEEFDNDVEVYDENNNRVFVKNGKLEVQIGDRWPRYAEPSDSEQSGIRWWKDDE